MPLRRPSPDKTLLRDLLAQRYRNPSASAAIDEEIIARFQRRVAILVLDMCGFTDATSRYGIIHYLSLIQRMEEAARPAVERNAGIVLKIEADNLFALFPLPDNALEAALDIFRSFDALNHDAPEEQKIDGCIGIGYGDVLLTSHSDAFGHEMNLACKLGEDVARRREILLTQAAYDALPQRMYEMETYDYRRGEILEVAFRVDVRSDG
jgi:class 3 adenylate cyclase